MFDGAQVRRGRLGRALMAISAVAAFCAATPAAAQNKSDQSVTFHKEIEPILQRSCQQCHRPDSIAPMSLITYQETRPYAREIKRRVALKNNYGQRGVMPPWFIEKNIGIQKFKDDISLSDDEVAKIAKWVDSGAPEGDAKDAPPALKFADDKEWFLGKPDLIVSSPEVLVKGVSPDWWGDFGETKITGLKENRYAKAVQYKEVSPAPKGMLKSESKGDTYAGQGKVALVVFHHGSAGVHVPSDDPIAGDPEANLAGQLSLHEVGRNGDQFPPEAGKLIPANGFLSWNAHVHSPGVVGADRKARLDLGMWFHPTGYKPKYKESGIQMGSTELDIRPDSDYQRYDGYWVAPQPVRMLNFEPHMHATGLRMCVEAIYARSIETLNCSGYDHNWVRNYQYDDNVAPLLPKGTILHVIGWFDGTAKNPNIIEPRNTTVYGRRTVSNMFGVENRGNLLTDEEYQEEVAKRKAYYEKTGEPIIGCPACYATTPTGPVSK
jgi:hypothetical protein